MALYSVGFISVVSQKAAFRAGNRELDKFFDFQNAEGIDMTEFLQYCQENLGYQASGLWRIYKYFKLTAPCESTLQGIASIYAGHFAIFSEMIDGGHVQRSVAGFNPASLLSSFASTSTLKEGGAIPGKWYNDEVMFLDGAKRVVSIPVSEAAYDLFNEKITELKQNKSNLFDNSVNKMMYGWYSLDENINKFNCVTAGISAVKKIMDIANSSNMNDSGLAYLSGVVDKMNEFITPLVTDGKGTLTPVLDAMQIGRFLCYEPAVPKL